ncbi:MAG: adenosylmethionine decarboxylase [Armatimonadota bacterium]|nr:adenosylmethionine decarboxylase [Fimbriimonadaceae bacterium]MCZ8139948.1 adenosylmethionine decarboxylase [Fimbriimonadaceae bacterium]
MATYTQILMSAAALAAVVPMAHSARGSWFSRIADRFRRSEPKQAVADPPSIPNDAGWQLIHSENADSFEAWLLKDQSGLPLGSSEQPSLGSHLLIELFDCDQTSLEKVSTVGKAMRDAAIVSEATVVDESFHEFEPWGVSGAVIIQESHYTIHTWPEHRYAAVDLFYCGGTIYVDKAIEALREQFKPGRMKFLVVRRGIESEVAG